ncbi:rhamnogalacturonan acetylesterase RgaE [Venturia nashicola]|uniref:Rhamnogalacturonan acetylesterase RgaE n=1 Tax=Venturia nashicola TaxID=86259 RepID=A0A4Z1PFY0_9PEZI|nr:rhamnogalacturonan acetylesterase RgaE [Venturia nashicola]TLD36752.1 rhamnogalacturonan acetylesterase RgaE [Venturia nashicola]
MVNPFSSSPALLAWLLLSCSPTAFSVKIYLCGDSTMAKSPSSWMQGWGEELPPLVNTTVVNKAMGGRSARSFAAERRFKDVAELLRPGDITVLEFGHNDGGSLKTDNGRSACPGSGPEICHSTLNGKPVTVKTFPAYLIEAGRLFASKGAKVVFSSMTPNNIFEGGKTDPEYHPSRFADFANKSSIAVGHNSTFVDHGLYTAMAYIRLGADTVNGFFPRDHTHTNEEGAKVVAQAFIQAVWCSDDPILMPYIIPQDPDGPCFYP